MFIAVFRKVVLVVLSYVHNLDIYVEPRVLSYNLPNGLSAKDRGNH